MERPVVKSKDKETQKIFEFIFNNALGNIRVRTDAEPTLDTMKANSIEVYGNNVYIKLTSAAGIKLTGSALS